MSAKPIIALDIDGTLGDYHAHFTRFAEQWSGRPMPDPKTINPGQPFHTHLGMGKGTYRACKLAFRQGGMHRSMPVYPGAREMVRSYRHSGAEVWLCTTRPYLRLDGIHPDTRHWLRRNKIQYDGLLFGPGKYRDLARNVDKDRVLAVLDDLPEMLVQAESVKLPVYLRDQPYNRYTSVYPRVDDFTLDGPWVQEMLLAIKRYKG